MGFEQDLEVRLTQQGLLFRAFPAALMAGVLVFAHGGVPSAAGRQTAGTRIGDNHSITSSAIGPIRLGMTLDQARKAAPAASFARATDGDGAALIEVRFAEQESVMVWAGEDSPEVSIDWSARIQMLETFSSAFHTASGIRPGARVSDVARLLGPVREIVESEIEARQYITFARQPPWLTLRIDYSGIFAQGSHRTTRFQPGARIYSVSISSSP